MQQLTVHQALQAASSLRARGQAHAAEDMCRQILAAYPDHANTLHTIGVLAGEAGRYEESIAFLSRALKTSAMPGVCLSDLGMAYLRADRFAEAAESFRRALQARPDMAETEINLAEAHWRIGEIDEAVHHCQKAIRLDPNYSKAHANLGLLSLLCGDYELGLREYEWRASEILPDSAPPQWNGEEAIGKAILVRAEQGLGDAIHFLRYLPLLREKSGARIVVESDPALLRLMRSVEELGVEFTDLKSPFRCDYQILLLSLPLALHQFGPVSTAGPYLSAPPAANLQSEGRLRVGLVWAGSPTHSGDRQRSIDPGLLSSLIATQPANFYSLQVGQRAPEGVIDLTSGITDFADTASIIAGLDLVISVDTAAAHLAGAMGKPVWTLLPFVPDWRWGLEGEETAWYPTMRLFRQKRAGDWAEVIQRVAGQLSEGSLTVKR